MEAREAILAALRAARPPAASLPRVAVDPAWSRPKDRADRFRAMLEAAGGRMEAVESDLETALESIAEYRAARRVVSLVPGVARATVDLDTMQDPRDLATCDFAVVPAKFGVAENGAVWLTDRGVRHRAVWFLPEHVAVVLDRDAIVDHLHDAYARISDDGLSGVGFGLLLCGPSKTADIEQALVIGAHGPRSLTVLVR